VNERRSIPTDTVLVDRYVIKERLGDANRSRTYRAFDQVKKRDVAVKLLGLDELSDWTEMESFNHEVAVLKSLHHRNAPEYLDNFRTEIKGVENLVMVTTYLPGENLAAIVEGGQRIDDKQFGELVRSLLSVLDYVHTLHPPLLHLDVCPENIVRSDRWYLVDFDATGGLTRNNPAAWSNDSFAAPEVKAGEPVIQSDLYSLGRCLQFVLTGSPDGDLGALTRKPGDRTIELVRTLTKDSPSARFASARAAAASFSAKRRRVSRRERLKEPARKQSKRKRGKSWSAIAAKPLRYTIILLVLGFVLFSGGRGIVNAIRLRLHAPVIEAAISGNVVEMKDLLDAGKSPNARNSDKASALNLALLYRHEQIARLLVEAGANVNYHSRAERDFDGPPIAIASSLGLTSIIDLLCDSGADVNVRYYSGATPLSLCIENGDVEAVRRIIVSGADLYMPDVSGMPPLTRAIYDGELAIARLLVAAGARADTATTGSGETPLLAAYWKYSESSRQYKSAWLQFIDDLESASPDYDFRHASVSFDLLHDNRDEHHVVAALLDPDLNLDALDEDGHTPLTTAIALRRNTTVEALLSLGADPNYHDNAGNVPLLLARNTRDNSLVAMLKERGAEEILSDENLLAAVAMGDIDAVEYMLESGMEATTTGRNGYSAFMYAVQSGESRLADLIESHGGGETLSDAFISELARSGNVESIRLLLDRGLDLDTAAEGERSLLDIAVSSGHAELAVLLRDAGAKVDLAQGDFVRDAARDNPGAVRAYIALGFDPNAVDESNQLPLIEAVANDARRATSALLEAGADPNVQSSTGLTPLMIASIRGRPDLVRALVAYDADLNIGRSTGETALTDAINQRNNEIAHVLLENGADPNVKVTTAWSRRRGDTPLLLARYYHLGDVAEALLAAGATTE